MGDIADWHVEQMTDFGHHWWHHSRRATPPVCRQCGVTCYWAERRGEWTLMENGRPHKCAPNNIENKAVDGFDDCA